MSIVFRGSLSLDRIDRSMAGPCTSTCTIDLRGTTWVDAYALVALACHIHETASRHVPVRFLPPRNANVGRYLTRMGLGTVLTEVGAQIDGRMQSVFRRRNLGDRLVELQAYATELEMYALCQVVQNTVAAGLDRNQQLAIWWTTGEAGGNALEHSLTAHGPFMAAQHYRKTHELVIGIGDTGQGLRSALHRHAPPTDSAAIDLAVTPGVSGTDDPARGRGLEYFIDGVLNLGGTATIRTGGALHLISRDRTDRFSVVDQRGTVVGVRVPCT